MSTTWLVALSPGRVCAILLINYDTGPLLSGRRRVFYSLCSSCEGENRSVSSLVIQPVEALPYPGACRQAGLQSVPWDGWLKYFRPKVPSSRLTHESHRNLLISVVSRVCESLDSGSLPLSWCPDSSLLGLVGHL